MTRSYSYEEDIREALKFCRALAREGHPSNPVFSGDIAIAFQIRHRALKDRIEMHYYALRSLYGNRVYRIDHKQRRLIRAMHGYMLPFQAVMPLLYEAGLVGRDAVGTLGEPEFLYRCFSSDGFNAHLN